MIRFRPIEPALLTASEAAAYLRLDEGKDADGAIRAIDRLVDQERLRPCLVGRHRRYSRVELDRFIAAETEKYGDSP